VIGFIVVLCGAVGVLWISHFQQNARVNALERKVRRLENWCRYLENRKEGRST
jgi:hypothetical protein